MFCDTELLLESDLYLMYYLSLAFFLSYTDLYLLYSM